VTLNITPVARWLMAQSSDFRTTSADTKGKRIVESRTAQKQFVLHYPKWSGLLCYTGVATAKGPGFSHDTAVWLERLLEHSPTQRRSPEDVVGLVISEGSTWLRRVPAEDRCTTFTMIAYDEKSIPRVWVISNFERPGQPRKWVGEDDLFLTSFRVRHPKIIVTGWAPAVLTDQEESLLDILAFMPDQDKLSDAVAMINRDAAERAKRSDDDEEEVSKECVVATLSPDGSGQILVYGDLPDEFVPCVILGGKSLDLAAPLKQQGSTGRMLDSISWPDRKQTLSAGVQSAVVIRFRDPWGFKWPDDPNATPRPKVPVTITTQPNDQSRPGSTPTTVEWLHREGS
jgi:hypothetical protein